ncbi:TPA: restriction endonuclease subunit S [Legionella pneumophila]|uniref:restriction endonuclease subunit S n=1 Tax=Legionella pneumophila TaxID=446 RepID=UPI001C1358E4|nr:restriction endonuclease subunit S [Legionella pneumophila]
MKQGWEIKNIGDVCKVIAGQSPEGKFYNKDRNGLPFYQGKKEYGEKYIGEPTTWTTKVTKEAEANDILMSVRAPVGPINFATQRICIGRGLAAIRATKLIDKEFLFNFLLKHENEIIGNTGAVFNSINKAQIESIKIPVPPLAEQQRIVAILDEAFAAIAKAKANAEQNLKNAKELFESYLQGVFENPKDNWEKKKWGDLCDFVRGPFGGSLKKNIFKDDGYVVYEQKHAIHDHFNQLRYFIDEDKFREMIRFELKPGDIIMSCSGVTLGRVAIVPKGIKRGIINQALLKLTPKKNISVHFLQHWLRSSIFQKIIFDYSGGAAIPNVPSAKILKDILIPVPSLKEQERVVSEIELISAQTQKLEAVYQAIINNLEELKKSILQKAFSGELTKVEVVA